MRPWSAVHTVIDVAPTASHSEAASTAWHRQTDAGIQPVPHRQRRGQVPVVHGEVERSDGGVEIGDGGREHDLHGTPVRLLGHAEPPENTDKHRVNGLARRAPWTLPHGWCIGHTTPSTPLTPPAGLRGGPACRTCRRAHDLVDDGPTHGAAMSNSLADSRPAEQLAIEPIAWLTTAGTDGQPQSSPVWFHWDGSMFWLRTQVAARKVKNIRANPKVALHLSDDGNGGDVVTVEGTAELRDGGSRQCGVGLLGQVRRGDPHSTRHQFRAVADRLPGDHSHPPCPHEDLVSDSRHVSGTPLSSCSPWSSKVIPEPAMRSTTVLATRTWLGLADEQTLLGEVHSDPSQIHVM